MRTRIIKADQVNTYAADMSEAAEALRAGKLVVFPTETVYGVAANAASPEAVAELRRVKGRPGTQPFTVHIGQRAQARQYLSAPSPLLRRLARKGWPGPLTLVGEELTPEQTEIAALCPPGQLGEIYRDGAVGLRCPDHSVATRLLTEAGVPVVASSANPHGAPPPFDARAALRSLDGMVSHAIDAGRTRFNSASTVVEVRGNSWTVRREGALDRRTIERLARSEVLFVCTGNSCRSPMAEYLFREGLAKRLECSPAALAEAGYFVSSAGTLGCEGGRASAGALEEMSRRGIDISQHRSQALTVELVHRAERIYAMSTEHRQAVLSLVPGAAGRVELLDPNGPVADPMGGTAEQYRVCAEQIEKAVGQRLEEFLRADLDW